MPSRALLAPAPAKLPVVSSLAPAPLGHHDRSTRIFPPLVAAGAGAGFSLFITLSVCFCKFKRKRSSPPKENVSSSPRKPPPREFSYSTLRRATDSFSSANRLGQGGFGVVFRGIVSTGQNVAIKVMDSGSLQGEAEFQNELFFAAKLDSHHVVPVIGFSHDRKRRRLLLVYQLMDNGNLQDALLQRRCPELMDWNRRFLVAINIAEGIEHLHTLKPPVIHGDIKPSNVLLDKLFSAKIADFGLARLKSDQVEITVAPEDYGSVIEEVESVIANVTRNEEINFGMVNQSPESVSRIPGSVTASPVTVLAPLGSPETMTRVVSVSPEIGESEKEGGIVVTRKGKEIESNVDRVNVKPKDYVMQWIGSELNKERPSSVDWIETMAATASSSSGKKLEKKSGKKLEWWLSLEEENENKKRKKQRMVRKWWKDEYHRELTKNKKKKEKTLESEFCSDDGSSSSISQWHHSGNNKSSRIDWWLDGLSGERWSRARGNSHDSVSSEIPKSCGISSTPSMRGTVCYAAPEYCNVDNNVSEKCDVYSYGVLLLVLISGRRPLEMTGSASEIKRANLMSWARKLARRGKLVDLVDQKLQNLDKEQAVLCIKVALLCLQRLPVSRPSMKEVLGMLKGEVSLPELPNEFSPSPPLTSIRKQRR